MKGIINLAVAATVVAGVAAQPHHQHQHMHLHKRHHSPIEERAPAPALYTEVVKGPTVVEYVLDGNVLDAGEAAKGVNDGLYVVVGETTPTFVPPPPPPPPTTSSTSSAAPSTTEAAIFKQLPTTTTTTTSSTTSSSSSSSTTSSTPPPAAATPAAAPVASPASSSGSSSAGVNAPFPNGQLDCTWENLEAYGARPLEWLGLGGFASIQTPNSAWSLGAAIDTIVEQVTGDVLTNSFVSYACPAGMEKSQWPTDSQPSDGVSVGGLYCNSEGKFELTNTDQTTICMEGAGGIYLKNELSEIACICQTNYPGDEKMSIDNCPPPGGSMPLTNVDSANYFQWEGKSTSGQFYVNPAGLTASDACVWTNPLYPGSAGNFAPLNIGIGMDDSGTTYLSIFLNTPSSTATLEYDVTITGDINAPCSYSNGAFTGGSSHGCTTSVQKGGSATFVLSQ